MTITNPFPLLLNAPPNNKNTLTQIHPELALPFKTHFELGGTRVKGSRFRVTPLLSSLSFLSLPRLCLSASMALRPASRYR